MARSAVGRGIGDWGAEGLPVCGLVVVQEAGLRESAVGPSRADQVEKLLCGGLSALWHPGLWHLLVSEVQGGVGVGGAEAVGAVA